MPTDVRTSMMVPWYTHEMSLELGKVRVLADSGKAIKVVLLEHRSKMLWIPRRLLCGDSKDLETLDVGDLTIRPELWWIQGLMRSDREVFEDIRGGEF